MDLRSTGSLASAAREVKALIGESNGKVDAGSKLVGDAGKTMAELLALVQRAAVQVEEIAAASDSQSGGLDRVNQSMKQIEGMTQQNAALVEQVSAAAGSLDDQAQRLSEAVAVFSVSA